MSDHNVNVDISIGVGDHFKNVDEFDKKLEDICYSKFVQYFKRDSRTIEAAMKKVKRYLNPNLKYYQIKYCCIHGGRKHIKKGVRERNKKTLRKEELCPSFIHLKASACGNQLEVTNIITKHNHVIDKQLFMQLPAQRKLPKDIRDDAKRLLDLNANKQLLRHHLEHQTNKIIKLKDLSNLQQENRKKYTNSIESSLKKISEKFRSDSHLLIDQENNFMGLMFCTPTMITYMTAFPEMLCIDATYKLLNIRAPVYLILLEDGNGESVVVAVGVLIREDKESLTWFLKTFQELNPAHEKTINIMADKDWNERNVLKELFPNAHILICLFHVLKIFQREITMEKMKISSSERKLALTLLQEIIYSKNDEEFNSIKNKIKEKLSKSVNEYLEKYWLNIHEEWCPYLGTKIMTFLNTTNNRIEGINAKLKSVINKNSSMEQFLDRLFVILKSLEKEQKSRLAHKINTRYVHNFAKNSIEYKYEKCVSEYAFRKIITQLSLRAKVIISNKNDDNNKFLTKSSDKSVNSYETTANECSCYFFNSMGLPCKHLFAILEHNKLDLFDQRLVKERWTQEYIFKNQIFFPSLSGTIFETFSAENNNTNTNKTNIEISKPSGKKKLSQHEKYKLINGKCKLIASLGSEASGKDFENVVKQLDKCIDIMSNKIYTFSINENTVDQDYQEVTETPSNNNSNNSHNMLEETIAASDTSNSLEQLVDTSNNINIWNANTNVEETGGLDDSRNDPEEMPSSISCRSFNINEIKMPTTTRPRGRPKGLTQTVIGLAKKKK